MTAIRTRRRVGLGIYADRYGISGTVKIHGIQREQRFPPDTDLEVIKSWRVRTRAELQTEHDETTASGAPPRATRGTFAHDLPRYLKTIQGRASYQADRSHLRAWLPFIGPLKRHLVRPSHVQTAIDTWQLAGKSARTIRHRRRVLRELYQRLDGAYARPPIKGVKIPRIPAPHPVPVPHAVIQRVAKSLRSGLTREQACGPKRTRVTVHRAVSDALYARFLVRAATGQRPSQIMRAAPADIDLRRRIWYVHAGKGGDPIPFPLNEEGVRAWKTFIKAKAWGAFDVRSFSKALRRHGWPKDVRPNQLRHTFAIDLLLKRADLGDVQGLLGHRQIETTRKHYAPVLVAMLRKTVGRRKLKLA